MTLARLSGATLGYGAGAVLSDLSLTLDPGERLVLLGRSGVGKTTLLAHLHDQMTGAGQRVALVPHTAIFANASVLPVFSSPAIESQLHRIPARVFFFFVLC